MKELARVSFVTTVFVLASHAWAQDQAATSFLQQAAETNIAEQEMAEVAQERAAREDVKEYAKHIEQDHEKANEKLKSIAERKNVELPDEPNKPHKQQKEQLSKLEGAAFDRAYLKAQVQAHQKTIKTFEQQARTAQDPEVKQYAQQALPTLREHLEQAQQLQQQSAGQSPGQTRKQSPQR